MLKNWSRTQKARALSSGEAEYYAMVSGCAEALGFQSLLKDLGYDDIDIVMRTDSTAAMGTSARRGLGKLRHVELRFLWLQDMVQEGRVKLQKVKGEENIADILTKPKTHIEMRPLLKILGGELILKDKGEQMQKKRDASLYRDTRGGGVLGCSHTDQDRHTHDQHN